MDTTTQMETLNVKVKKGHVLGNQQPSPLMFGGRFNDQGLTRTHQAVGKRKASERMKIWSDLCGNVQQGCSCRNYLVLCNNTKKEHNTMIKLELQERFHEKWELNEETGCWIWKASLAGRGYGQIKIPGQRKQIYAHQLSYLIHYGSIPQGMMVCHTCDNTKCVKPSHLFLGTQKDNMQDMKNKGRHLNGSKNAKAKLTEAQVRAIHTLNKKGSSQGKLAKIFGVSQGQVFRILHGHRWNHIFREFHSDKD